MAISIATFQATQRSKRAEHFAACDISAVKCSM